MKIKSLCILLLSMLPSMLVAQWKLVGSAEYTWGPFNVYRIGLYSETGKYQADDFPLMFAFKYQKPIEGKNFAISLIKEIDSLKLNQADSKPWLEQLQQILPDFSPDDILYYILLEDKGYFIFNDTVLTQEFDSTFNQAFMQIWLSPTSHFIELRSQLIGEKPSEYNDEEFQYPRAIERLDEDVATPELPPNYPLRPKQQDQS